MWDILSSVAVGLGTLFTWKGYTNRDNQTEPHGVEAGTPSRDWPKSISPAEHTNHQFARHWQASLVVGAVLLVCGLIGTFVDSYRLYADPEPSRDHIFETISKDPTNTMDRDELNCMLDFYEPYGVDITRLGEEEMLRASGAAFADVTDADIARLESCFDAETLAQHDGPASRMSDEQLRVIFIEAIVNDPVEPLDRPTATCLVDVIEERGVLQDLADERFTAEVESALLDAEISCL